MKNSYVTLPKKRPTSLLCSILFGAILVSSTFFIAGAIIGVNHKQLQQLRAIVVQRFPELKQPELTPTDVCQVRKQSFNELETFKRRWRKAVQEDDCWVDPYNHQ
ncbi:hypothetical protein M8C21_026436 [Ambrosia artemisiifolia]|uniref:Uncharacterized protein n=1 Tax=Ambrosia artemisiifolia TaxID=4212 RepID=A0AAD5C4Z9_AMBAR|nr:hypothetical protein M8C21_026436 [Ambrosia artemisiifolia]